MNYKNIKVMKKTYFEPEMRIVKLHGRARLLEGSLTSVRRTSTNLGDDDAADDFYYEGAGAYEGR